MISTLCTRAWANAVTRPAAEFPLTPLPLIAGQLPPGLRGSLYRNGPARLERGGQRMGHWFDGDGAILAVHFSEAGATATYRFVQTVGYQAETKAGKLQFGNYGTIPAGPIWQRWGRLPKNTANTSVLAVEHCLLALWEGGHPHALDLQDLETFGEDTLNLADPQPYSAHPKRDPQSQEIYNFGVSFGGKPALNLYRSGRDGKVQKQARLPLDGVPLIHDFVLADRYLVFCIPPVRLNPWPVLLALQSMSDALVWRPQLGTQILVVDRETLSLVSRSETEPWFQWHFGNGCLDADGNIVLTLVRYPDFQTNQYLKEVASGRVQTLTQGGLWQVRLHPQSGQVLEMQPLVERGCEFPLVPPHQVGQASQSTYLTVHRAGGFEQGELFGAIARFDHATETLAVADLGENRYPVEPIYAPDPENADRGWILSVVYDGDRDCSEVWIWDDRLTDQPLCRLALPSVVPLGFHGTWNPA